MNDDTISRQAAIDALAEMHCKSDEDGYVWIVRSDAWSRIDALPSVQPEQKHGRWICGCCSYCGYILTTTGLNNYCPNCGANMEER